MRAVSPSGGVELNAGSKLEPSLPDPPVLLKLVSEHGFAVVRDAAMDRGGFAELIDGLGTVQPPSLSVLYCEHAPETGGETLLCDTAAGGRHPSPTFRAFMRTLTAEHRSDGSFSARSVYATRELVGVQRVDTDDVLVATHPLLATSPLRGDEYTFFSPTSVTRLIGLSAAESRAVLNMLRETFLWHEYISRITWDDGTLLLWDNYRFVHRALNQGLLGRRTLLRANLLTTPRISP